MSSPFRPVPLPAADFRALGPLLEPGEIAWPVPGARPYYATTHGRLFSVRWGRARPCPGTVVKGGYTQSWIRYDDGTLSRPHLHRVIALAFIGPAPVDTAGRPYEVHHVDRDPQNNAPDNLRYEPKVGHAQLSIRDRAGHVKLDEATVWVARCRALAEPVALVLAEVAGAAGCSVEAVRQAVKGETWDHVPAPSDPVGVAELAGALGVGLDQAAWLLELAGPMRRAA